MLGFLNLFKPAGPTSTQFGARLRRLYPADGGKLAVGHLGTLDPQAAGVLPVALGRATRLLPLIADKRKAYAFTLVLGRATETGDATGAVTHTAEVPSEIDSRRRSNASPARSNRCRRCTAPCTTRDTGSTISRARARWSSGRRAA
jgi:tRNA pseudouridine(55) synthase